MDIGKTVKEGDRQPEPFKIPGISSPSPRPLPQEPRRDVPPPVKTPEKEKETA